MSIIHVYQVFISQGDEKKMDSTKHHNVIHLLKTSNIRNVTLIVCLVW